jgi:fibro-slime domain-containing protein
MRRMTWSRRIGGIAPSGMFVLVCVGAVAIAATVGCSSASIINDPKGGSGGGGNGGNGGGGKTGGDGGSGGVLFTIPDANLSIDRPTGGKCGDGVIERNESCDDGNTIGGDGCSKICQTEANWYCPHEGQPCENLAKCGNGILTSDEVCDDGNTLDGDGCSHDCKKVESGWQCRVPGKSCTPSCGDGAIAGWEACDDGNTVSGDGCSSTCHLELGFKCDKPGKPCSKTTCGDGKKEGAESCDDGNTVPFDGCSEDCQIEPSCTAGSGCTSQCGDGIVLGEDCDDGNAIDGDGCSSKCKKEDGWTCTQPDIGDTMKVPVVYRDFRFGKPADFESGASGSYDAITGMVQASLSSDKPGKPVLASPLPNNAHVTSADTFKQWYTDVSGTNHTTASKMTLWNDGKGNYVNRYGANGEQWNTTAPANWCGTVADAMLDASGKPIPCTFKYQAGASDGGGNGGQTDCQKMEAQGYTQLPGSCKANTGGTYTALYIVNKQDGNPLFFPVDGDSFTPQSEFQPATIPPYYDASNSWPFDTDASGNKKLHNFSFTSEVRYWFPYSKSKSYTLDFVGDDDVWVFINGKLALDLGGVHTPVLGDIVIGSNGNGTTTVQSTYPNTPSMPTPVKGTANLGLQDGKVYEIAVFQAERQTSGSSYKLTLSGFNAAPTSCTPTCGDGVTVADEECDCGTDPKKVPSTCNGVNDDNSYGGCTTKCKWGGYCGDGITNGTEECDNGSANGTQNGKDGCTLGCTRFHYCGDGNLDTDRQEECDLGDRNGQTLDSSLNPSSDSTAQVYCNTDCTIPPSIVY